MRWFLFVLLFAPSTGLLSQYVIRGNVINAMTKNPLIGCSVFNLNTQTGTITNEKGNFMLQVNKGDQIQFSYIGMVVVTKYILDTGSINLALNYQSKKIKDVIINPENYAKNSILYNPDYEKYKNAKQIEPEAKTAKQYRQEAISSSAGVMSPISLIYYSLPKVKRRLQAVIDIQTLDASNQKYSLDFISLVTDVQDEKELKNIKAYCYFPAEEVLGYSYYQLGVKLRSCYLDYLSDPNIPKPIDSTVYNRLEK